MASVEQKALTLFEQWPKQSVSPKQMFPLPAQVPCTQEPDWHDWKPLHLSPMLCSAAHCPAPVDMSQ